MGVLLPPGINPASTLIIHPNPPRRTHPLLYPDLRPPPLRYKLQSWRMDGIYNVSIK